MKTLALCLSLLVIVTTGYAQTTLSVDNPVSEGGRLRICNSAKTGATTSDWSIWNMTNGYGNGLSFWRYYADGTNAGPAVWFGDNGNVGIGTSNPGSKLEISNGNSGLTGLYVSGGGGNASTAVTVTSYPMISTSGTNYIRNLGFYSWNLPIASGVTDNGYRIGLDIENFVTDPAFQGTLNTQFGLWARVGSYSGGAGTIQNSYAVYAENLDGPATVVNKYGIYQSNASAKNHFAGNVGIGTTSPTAKLHIGQSNQEIRFDYNGTDSYYGSLRWAGLQLGNNGANRIVAGRTQTGGLLDFYVNNTNEAADYSQNPNGILAVRMSCNGNVGIGTTSPTEKLSVNGKIRAKEVIVDTGWSDYVFAKDYKLAPLSEVEQHIEQQGHLPGVPSAKEVAANGVSVGDMQAILLAKIEELTLHQIAQEKELATQRAKLEAQASQISTQQAEIIQLKTK